MKIFSIESPVYKFIVRFWDIVKLNFMWLLFSLPIITIGASTVAAYSVALKMAEDTEGHVVRQFVKAFKQNWKQGIPLGLMLLVSAYFVYLNIELFNKIENNPMIFSIAAIVIAFLALIYLTYAFALSARHENSLINTIKNSAAICMKYFGRTVFLWLIVVLMAALFMFNTALMFLGLLIGPASIIFTVSFFALRLFKQIDNDAQSGVVET